MVHDVYKGQGSSGDAAEPTTSAGGSEGRGAAQDEAAGPNATEAAANGDSLAQVRPCTSVIVAVTGPERLHYIYTFTSQHMAFVGPANSGLSCHQVHHQDRSHSCCPSLPLRTQPCPPAPYPCSVRSARRSQS